MSANTKFLPFFKRKIQWKVELWGNDTIIM